MINITKKEIMENISDPAVFKSGHAYYASGRIAYFKHHPDYRMIEAAVIGNQHYDVEILLSQNGRAENCVCTCADFESKEGYCKHIVATLLYAIESAEAEGLREVFRVNAAKRILDNIQSANEKERMALTVQYNLEMEQESKVLFLWLKIGEERLYVIKDVRSFLNAVRNHEIVPFGKTFTYDPFLHTFAPEDEKIIQLFMRIHDDENYINKTQLGVSRNIYFDEKKINLRGENLSLFLDLVASENLNVIVDGTTYKQVGIVEEDVPVDFIFKDNLKSLELSIVENKAVVPLTEDRAYTFYENAIHKTSEQQLKRLQPFLHTINRSKKRSIVIRKELMDDFVSLVYPELKHVGSVTFDESLEKQVERNELKTMIYLDREDEKVTVKIRHTYGLRIIDPLKPEKSKVQYRGRIIVRDLKKENRIMALMESSSFKVSKEYYFIDEEDAIYAFMVRELQLLKDEAEVYYSDSFKELKIRDKESITSNISIRGMEDYLSFEFSIEGLDSRELPKVMAALKEKKKFYKLKDNSFLPLELAALQQFAHLAEHMGLSKKQMEQQIIEIPKYRAFYLNEQMDEFDIKHCKRNLDFKELIVRMNEPEDEFYKIPEAVAPVLRDYQVTGFNWLKLISGFGFGGILADDMGLGKTLQVLTYLQSEKERAEGGTSLIVAPTSLVYNWMSEVEKFIPSLKVLLLVGSKEERKEKLEAIEEADIVITSYTMVRNDIDLYKKLMFKNCILDEAQHIKNYASKTSKAIKTLNARTRFALTGTPIENALSELWSMFDFVMPGYLHGITKFRKDYETPIVKKQDSVALKRLKKQVNPFIIRRLKTDVLSELPEKIENEVVVELNEEQKKVYLGYLEKIKGELVAEIAANGYEKSQMKILAALTRLRQICCDPALFLDGYDGGSGKLDLLDELLDELFEGQHRVLLFSQFTSMLAVIKEHLEAKGIEYYYLDGATKADVRHQMVSDFNEGQCGIFLISLKAGGTGLNLTGADTVIHFDPWWNPAVEDQATDRVHRIGQKKVVHVLRLITKGTIEEKIYHLQEKKREMINNVIQPGETFISKMTEEEIRDLLEIE